MDIEQLNQLRALSLERKIAESDLRIWEWHMYHYGKVCVNVSGGLDSTVLLHMVRRQFPDVPAVAIYAIECSENKRVLDATANLVKLNPSKSQMQVLKEHGYPVVSKKVAKAIRMLQNPTDRNAKSRFLYLNGVTSDGRDAPRWKLPQKWRNLIDAPFKVSEQCCYFMKEEPLKRYQRETGNAPYVGLRADESERRLRNYLERGCNVYTEGGISMPLGFWTRQDILQYIVDYKLEYSKAYGDIVKDADGKWVTTKAHRTGCAMCAFGVHLEARPNRFERMYTEDPKMWNLAINTMGYGPVLDYIGVPYKPKEVSHD